MSHRLIKTRFLVGICCFGLSACSSVQQKPASSFKFGRSEELFNERFPNNYPPNEVQFPLGEKDKRAIEGMVSEVSKHLFAIHVTNEVNMRSFEVLVSTNGESELNKLAHELSSKGISFKYDGLYFAQNPFSAGTFRESEKALLISHLALANPDRMNDVIKHELVHVQTFWNKSEKKPSLFYCKFKGSQFGPHYLPCDEMNAYHHDLERLKGSPSAQHLLPAKLKAARKHTEPIPGLIDSLALGSARIENGLVLIDGSNVSGPYQMEFPIFAVKGKPMTATELAKTYCLQLKTIAKEYVSFISSISERR